MHQLANLTQAIAGPGRVTPLAADFHDGYRNAQACDALLAAARTGKRVRV